MIYNPNSVGTEHEIQSNIHLQSPIWNFFLLYFFLKIIMSWLWFPVEIQYVSVLQMQMSRTRSHVPLKMHVNLPRLRPERWTQFICHSIKFTAASNGPQHWPFALWSVSQHIQDVRIHQVSTHGKNVSAGISKCGLDSTYACREPSGF